MTGWGSNSSIGNDAPSGSSRTGRDVVCATEWRRTGTGDAGPLSAALSHTCGFVETTIRIDGGGLLVAFVLDNVEHERRRDVGVAAATSTGLLHALWLLPALVPVPASALPPVKVKRLRASEGWVHESPSGFERDFNPAGQVIAVGLIGRDGRRLLDRTVAQPPVFERVAFLRSSAPRSLPHLTERAVAAGVGLWLLDGDTGREVVAPLPALRGVPGVFRWWVAELAYSSWLQDRTQPVS